MKKYFICLVLIFLIIAQSVISFAADTFDKHVEGALSGCGEVDLSIIPEGTDIDSLTTTSVNPWMKQFHLTTPNQAAAGFLGGECGQKCFTITAAPTNCDLVLLGTDTETIWRSEDGGLSWVPSDDGIPIAGTIYMTFSPDDENIAFVSVLTNESGAAQKGETGIYKSTDAGKSWRQVLNVTYQPRVFSNCTIKYSDVRKDGKRDLYVCGTHSGVFKSEDEGETWVNIGLTEEYIESIEAVDDAVFACTQKSGLLVTYDDGVTWTKINEGIEEEYVRAIAFDPLDEKNHWFCVSPEKLYESKDSGKSWKAVCTYQDAGYKDKKFFRLNFSSVRDNGKPRLYVTSSSIQHPMRFSDDYGKTFKRPQVDNTLAIIQDNWGYSAEPYYVHPKYPDIMWISLDGQIMKSNDGGENLFPASSGYSGMRAANFYFDINGDENAFWITCIDRSSIMSAYTGNGEDYPLVYYTPNEDRFKNVRYGGAKTSKSLAVDPKNPKRILENRGNWGANSIIKESLDGGLNWHDVEGTHGCDTRFLEFNPDNPNTIYAGNFVSYDDGKTWITPQYKMHVRSPFNGNIVYAVANSALHKSTDEGRTWETICSGLPSGMQRISADKFKEDKFYIGTVSSGICVIEDGKVRMLNDKNGLTRVFGRVPIYSVAQNPENEKHLVAGGLYATYNYCTPGLFESYDGGESWYSVPGVLNAADIWIVEFRASKKQVWIGTSGGTYVYEYEKFFDAKDTLYTDIDSSYARSEIISLYNDGFYDKFTDGNFEPKGFTTRGEFAKYISRFLNAKREKQTSVYKDVEKDNVSNGGYVYPYIQSLYDKGIFILSDDENFNPDAYVTYDQLVIIASRILNNYHIQDEFEISDLQNADDIPAFARYAYYKVKTLGILDDKISFESGKEATNEDIAHFMFNLKAFIQKTGGGN